MEIGQFLEKAAHGIKKPRRFSTLEGAKDGEASSLVLRPRPDANHLIAGQVATVS